MTNEFGTVAQMRGERNGADETLEALQGDLDHLRICVSLAEEGTAGSRVEVDEMRVQITKIETRIAKLRQKWS